MKKWGLKAEPFQSDLEQSEREEIMQRFDMVEVVGQPERVYSSFVKGYTHLPVRLHGLS